MKRTNQGRWLSITEASQHASRTWGHSVHIGTVYRWLAADLPHTRIAGTTVRILTLDLDAWLAARLDLVASRQVAALVRHPPAPSKAPRQNLARKR
jgi:hypothetical protein